MNPLHRVQKLFLLWVVVLLAGAAVFRPGVTQEPPWPVLAGGCFLSAAAGVGLIVFGITSRARGAAYTLVALVAWIFLAYWLGDSLDDFRSKTSLCHWIGFLAVFLAVLVGVRTRQDWHLLAGSVVTISSGISLYGLAQYAGQKQERLLSTFTNADNFSLYPMAGIFLALGMYRYFQGPVRLALQLATIVQLLALLLTGARATLIGLTAGLILLAILLSIRCASRKSDMRPVVETFSPLIVAIVLLGLSSFFVLPSLTRWGKLFSGEDSQGVTMRRDVLVHGFRAALSRPLRGYGPGCFSLAYQAYRPHGEIKTRIYVNVAHNDYVELAVESGLVALALWLAFLVTCTTRATRFSERSPWGHEVASACAAFWGFAIYSLLNFLFAVPANHLLLSLLLGLAVSPNHAGETFFGNKERLTYPAICLLAIGIGIWGIGYTWKSHDASLLLRDARRDSRAFALERAEEKLTWAGDLAPQRSEIFLEKSRVLHMLGAVNSDPGKTNEALEALKHAHALSPRNLTVLRALADAYMRAGQSQNAESLLREALRNSNYYDDLRVILTNMLVSQGRISEALKIMCEVYKRDSEWEKPVAHLLAEVEAADPGAALRIVPTASLSAEQLEPIVTQAMNRLLAKKKFVAADNVCRVWGQQHGEDVQYWLNRADIWAKAGEPERALRHLERAVEERLSTSPGYEKALVAYAEEATRQNQAAKAQKRLGTYLEGGSAGPSVYAALAKIYLSQKKLDTARSLLAAGLELHEHHPSLLTVRAQLSLLEGAPDSALEDAREALEAEPKNNEAREIIKRAQSLLNGQ